jgi:RNA polymerase sigma factor (sigma-70 family)
MGSTLLSPPATPSEVWSDSRLIQECLNGNDEAWSALIHKYKRLIYSIPIRCGLTPDDAADVFQSVCLEALSQLETLREPRALPKWLIQVAAHKSYRFKQLLSRSAPLEKDTGHGSNDPALPPEALEILHEAEREQLLREAIAGLSPRCAQLVQMLFFEEPPLPYAEVAQRLGIATGSIGFIRGRCLKRLRERLQGVEE